MTEKGILPDVAFIVRNVEFIKNFRKKFEVHCSDDLTGTDTRLVACFHAGVDDGFEFGEKGITSDGCEE